MPAPISTRSIICLLGIAFALPLAEGAETVDLASADTAVSVAARDDRLILASLRSNQSGQEWLAPDGSEIPLIRSGMVDGIAIAPHLRFTRAQRSRDGCERTLVFVNDDPRLELRSLWRAFPGPGPVEHGITIANLGQSSLLLPVQPTLVFAAHAAHAQRVTWVSKGSGRPRDDGTHVDEVKPGYAADLRSGPYAEYDDAIPWVSVDDGEGAAGWYAGIEFSGRRAIPLRE